MDKTAELLKLAVANQEAMLEWIDGVPRDIELPTMCGFDRDAVEDELHRMRDHLAFTPPPPAADEVERVARAIHPHPFDKPQGIHSTAYYGLVTWDIAQEHARDQARAAIAALRPTDEVQKLREALERIAHGRNEYGTYDLARHLRVIAVNALEGVPTPPAKMEG